MKLSAKSGSVMLEMGPLCTPAQLATVESDALSRVAGCCAAAIVLPGWTVEPTIANVQAIRCGSSIPAVWPGAV